MLDAINPKENAETFASSLPGSVLSAKKVPVQARVENQTPAATEKRRFSGALIVNAVRPKSESR
jgi:hypothetical protein